MHKFNCDIFWSFTSCLSIFVLVHFASAHTWTDKTGKYSVEAEFVLLDSNTVTLEERRTVLLFTSL